jgi:hypothetical protein
MFFCSPAAPIFSNHGFFSLNVFCSPRAPSAPMFCKRAFGTLEFFFPHFTLGAFGTNVLLACLRHAEIVLLGAFAELFSGVNYSLLPGYYTTECLYLRAIFVLLVKEVLMQEKVLFFERYCFSLNISFQKAWKKELSLCSFFLHSNQIAYPK